MALISRLSVAAVAVATGAYSLVSSVDLYAGPVGNYIRSLEPERAHNLAVKLASCNLLSIPPRIPFFPRRSDPPILASQIWGMRFGNPIGLAAGFDKHAQAMRGLFSVGFGFVEVGSITPLPQPGNPKPRVFRLEEDGAIINRYGFNSHGADVVSKRVNEYDNGGRSQHLMGVFGVNLGKNKDTSEEKAVDDYLIGLRKFGEMAEYIVINVSSPNTPGLRDLQGRKRLEMLLEPIMKARDELIYRPPIVVKISPDLDEEELNDVCAVVMKLKVDGMIVSNTTVSKEGLVGKDKEEQGGVSGRPLKKKSTEMIRKVYEITEGKITLIGVGGVESGKDAYDKIRAGASLIQLYTALIYKGPWLISRIKKELVELLEKDGFGSISEAVGVDHRMNDKLLR